MFSAVKVVKRLVLIFSFLDVILIWRGGEKGEGVKLRS
jgi:hypothetical protein